MALWPRSSRAKPSLESVRYHQPLWSIMRLSSETKCSSRLLSPWIGSSNWSYHGKSRQACERFCQVSLPTDAEEEDRPPPATTKKRKVETADVNTGEPENASTTEVKEWADAYCKDVIGCTMHNLWGADSDDESELESESEGAEDEELVASDAEGDSSTARIGDEISSMTATTEKVGKNLGEESAAEAHRFPGGPSRSSGSPTDDKHVKKSVVDDFRVQNFSRFVGTKAGGVHGHQARVPAPSESPSRPVLGYAQHTEQTD